MLVAITDYNLVAISKLNKWMTCENLFAVSPLSWAGPAQSTDFQIVSRPAGLSAPYFVAPVFDPVGPLAKKQATGHPTAKKREASHPNAKKQAPAHPTEQCTNPLRGEPKVEKPQQARDCANEL